MPTAVQETITVLELIVQAVPVGTNLGLLTLLWAMLSGSFLSSRGAIFPALQANGFDEGQMRRSWSALRYGSWTIEKLIGWWRDYVLSEGEWQGNRYEGYRPVAVDWTAFWRPQLKGWGGRCTIAWPIEPCPVSVLVWWLMSDISANSACPYYAISSD